MRSVMHNCKRCRCCKRNYSVHCFSPHYFKKLRNYTIFEKFRGKILQGQLEEARLLEQFESLALFSFATQKVRKKLLQKNCTSKQFLYYFPSSNRCCRWNNMKGNKFDVNFERGASLTQSQERLICCCCCFYQICSQGTRKCNDLRKLISIANQKIKMHAINLNDF